MIGQAQLQASMLKEYMRTNNAGPLLPFPKEIADKVDNFLRSEQFRFLTATQQKRISLETDKQIADFGGLTIGAVVLPALLPISFVACAVVSAVAVTTTLVAGGYFIMEAREEYISNFCLLNGSPFFTEIQQIIDERLESFTSRSERRQLKLERNFVANHIAPGKYYELPKRKKICIDKFDIQCQDSNGRYYNKTVEKQVFEIIPAGWRN